MTYEQFRDHVLDLLNQRSSNGVILDNLYNDQSDYFLRIPSLYNSAVEDIANNYADYYGVLDKDLCMPESLRGGYVRIHVPEDCIELQPVLVIAQGRPTRVGDYHQETDATWIIRKDLFFGNTVIRYRKHPAKLPTVIGADIDMLHLDGDENQQMAAALYVAARLCLEDDAFAYSSFMNEYDDRCSNMETKRTAETVYTADIYDTENLYGGEWF